MARLLGTLHDITASERLAHELGVANEELQQVNRLNADVLGLVGHDVRQPLSPGARPPRDAGAEIWDEAPDEARIQRVDKALGAARRLSSLLDDILAMANLESGTIATRALPLSLRDVVVEALTDVHGGGAVQVTAEGDPRGHADPFHLRQMVTNLVGNALRYGADPVEVAIVGGDGESVVTVTDHGRGVPADFVPHLFERFRGSGRDVARAPRQRVRPLHRRPAGGGERLPRRLHRPRAAGVHLLAERAEPDLDVPCERVPDDPGVVEGQLAQPRGDRRPAATGRRRRPTRPAARRARRAGPRGRR